jgi:hypothetical protein
MSRSRERGIAVPRRDVENALARPYVNGFADALTNDLQCGTDD